MSIGDDFLGRQAFNDIFLHGDAAYDEDFPALPTRRPAAPPGLSRVSSLHNSVDLGARSSTPKLPPGLNISHAHPAMPENEEVLMAQKSARTAVPTPGPVVPALPNLSIGQPTETSKQKVTESTGEKTEQELVLDTAKLMAEIGTEAITNAKDISLGSPAPKKAQPKPETPSDISVEAKTVSEPAFDDDTKDEREKEKGDAPVKIRTPSKLHIPEAATNLTAPVTQLEAAPIVASEIAETPSVLGSRPETPATAASDTPSRAAARPRTLRVVTGITKQAETTPASATTEKFSGMLPPSFDRQHSRRPSVSSVSHTRSSTPAMSEAFSFGASRASSPPPSIIGSAPERNKTKAQQRKDRKEKSKQTTESEQASGATTPIVGEVAPVISRQRKQKRRVGSSAVGGNVAAAGEEKVIEKSESPLSLNKEESVLSKVDVDENTASKATATAKPKRQGSKKSSAPATPKEPESRPSSLIHEPPQPKWTLRDLYNYAAKYPDADIQTLLSTRVSSMAEILASLTSTKDIEPSNPLFNPPPLSSYRLPTDPRRGADYLDANGYTDSNPFGMLYLTQDKKRAIQNGHAVRISDASKPNDLLRRAMVSPTGTVWRHLNEAEEERVLELEERREVYAEEWGAMGLGLMDKLTVLEEDDYMNIEGGMEGLSRSGEAHGVSWVMRDAEEEEEDVIGDENDDELDYDDEDEDITDDDDLGLNVPGGWETGLALGTVPENVNITNKANVLPPMRLAPGHEQKANLRTMDVEKLVKRIAEAQKEVEAARKEMEKIEKNTAKKSKEVARWKEAAMKVT